MIKVAWTAAALAVLLCAFESPAQEVQDSRVPARASSLPIAGLGIDPTNIKYPWFLDFDGDGRRGPDEPFLMPRKKEDKFLDLIIAIVDAVPGGSKWALVAMGVGAYVLTARKFGGPLPAFLKAAPVVPKKPNNGPVS